MVFWVDDGADTGPIASQRHVVIRPEDNASSLWGRELFRLGLELLEEVLNEIAAGTPRRVPQDEALATWEPSCDGRHSERLVMKAFDPDELEQQLAVKLTMTALQGDGSVSAAR